MKSNKRRKLRYDKMFLCFLSGGHEINMFLFLRMLLDCPWTWKIEPVWLILQSSGWTLPLRDKFGFIPCFENYKTIYIYRYNIKPTLSFCKLALIGIQIEFLQFFCWGAACSIHKADLVAFIYLFTTSGKASYKWREDFNATAWWYIWLPVQ